ncbi:unnamed protein product [Protopolystoma xenopodis]|uniref:Uncharacterized protein n=1 Tax=Protopolystoma xenopodis TaxID=117903 RepID=A0A3S5AYW8_9PLAT|nr:unnamed protein product [Protopolystoma xenopodis]
MAITLVVDKSASQRARQTSSTQNGVGRLCPRLKSASLGGGGSGGEWEAGRREGGLGVVRLATSLLGKATILRMARLELDTAVDGPHQTANDPSHPFTHPSLSSSIQLPLISVIHSSIHPPTHLIIRLSTKKSTTPPHIHPSLLQSVYHLVHLSTRLSIPTNH